MFPYQKPTGSTFQQFHRQSSRLNEFESPGASPPNRRKGRGRPSLTTELTLFLAPILILTLYLVYFYSWQKFPPTIFGAGSI